MEGPDGPVFLGWGIETMVLRKDLKSEKLKLDRIVLDLSKFTISLSFKQKKEPLTLLFNTPSRRFFFSVIALIVTEMKIAKKLKPVHIRNLKDELVFLDQRLAMKYASKDPGQMFDKIRKAWRNNLPRLQKGRHFVVLDRRKISDQKEGVEGIEYVCSESECDIWATLFDYDETITWRYKFAVDNVSATLDDLCLVYRQDEGKNAWDKFIKDLEAKVDVRIEEEGEGDSPGEKAIQKDAVLQFLETIETNFKSMKMFHSDQKIVMEKQYIPIQVTLERKYQNEIESSLGYAESEEDLERAYAFNSLNDEATTEKVPWKKARVEYDRIMILADPGIGKSTLLRMEAQVLAQGDRRALLDRQKSVEDIVFPLLFNLYDLAQSQKEVFDLVLDLIERDYPRTHEVVYQLLRDKLRAGKCVLLLDGLDEVPIELRMKLSEKLNRFARNYECPIICTSRIVGYDTSFLNGAKEVEIIPFEAEQIERYIEGWFKSITDFIEDGSTSAARLIRELRNKPQIIGLAQNPLLLSFLCGLYLEGKTCLPTQRAQIYQEAVDLILRKWSQKRKQQSEGVVLAKGRLLEELAYKFFCERKDIFSFDELYDFVELYLQGSKTSTDLKRFTSGELIDELSEHDGILTKLGISGKRYAFFHKAFHEYFTACYLKREIKKNETRGIELARSYFWDFEWHDIFILLASLLDDPVPFLDKIIMERDDIYTSMLLLAGKCIAQCEERIQRQFIGVIDQIFEKWRFWPKAHFLKSAIISIGKNTNLVCKRLEELVNNSDGTNSNIACKTLEEILKKPGEDIGELAAHSLHEIATVDAVQILIRALTNESPEIRRISVTALGYIGNQDAIDSLIRILQNDGVPEIRRLAAIALGRIGKETANMALVDTLRDKDEDSDIRHSAAYALCDIGGMEATQVLIDVLNSKDEKAMIRRSVANALAEIGIQIAKQGLEHALDSNNPEISQAAAIALGHVSNDKGTELLIKMLMSKYENKELRQSAASALADIANPESVRALTDSLMIKDEDSVVRLVAVDALGHIGNEAATQALAQALVKRDNQIEVKQRAAQRLGQIGNEDALYLLIDALNDEEQEFPVREAVAYALGQIAKSEATGPLMKTLQSSDRGFRRAVTYALADIANPESVRALTDSLMNKDEDSVVRLVAVDALGRIGNEEATQALAQTLVKRDNQKEVKQRAAQRLGQIGNEDALYLLIDALNDEDQEFPVREAVAYALGQIGKGEATGPLIRCLNNLQIEFATSDPLEKRFCEEEFSEVTKYIETSVDTDADEASMGDIGNAGDMIFRQVIIEHPEKYLRLAAVHALFSIGNEEATRALIKHFAERSIVNDLEFLLRDENKKFEPLCVFMTIMEGDRISIYDPMIYLFIREAMIQCTHRLSILKGSGQIDYFPIYAEILTAPKATLRFPSLL